jgi:hypothetical protein
MLAAMRRALSFVRRLFTPTGIDPPRPAIVAD